MRWGTILRYFATFVGAFVLASLALRFGVERLLLKHKLGEADLAPKHLRSAEAKVAYYRAHASEYDTIFIGDSRTLCGFDPVLVDAEIGTHSVNLAHWAVWFETQYAKYFDLTTMIPEGTRVVWSVGHLNFLPIHPKANMTYPIRPERVPQYLRFGYSPERILDNVATSIPGVDLFARREELRSGLDVRINAPLFPTAPDPVKGLRNAAEYAAIRGRLAGDPTVAQIDPITDGDEITSAAVWMWAGNYRRIEIDHAFFRRKQEEGERLQARVIQTEAFEPDPALWNTFVGILDLFRERHVNLVVNEVHESPFRYKDVRNRRLYAAFLDKVRHEVEAHGFPYLRANFDEMLDEDYFDYDHVNDVGSKKVSHLLAQMLAATR